jgi:hypothetical protein
MERTLIALMQRSSSDCPEVEEGEAGAEGGAVAVSVGSDIRRPGTSDLKKALP